MLQTKFLTTLISFLIALSFVGCAEAGPQDVNQAEVEAIIKNYLMEHPEIIREALIELNEREDRASIVAVKNELHNDSRDYSYGPKNAKVTVVEFFDYNCSFCKQSTDWLQQVMKEHPNDVRVVFKELPILDRRTRTSRNAAKAALAAGRQGKYNEMHVMLMGGTNLDDKFINSSATKLGLNLQQFKKDMADPKLDEQIEDGLVLAASIPGLTGTPFFVINDKFLASGNTDALQNMLDTALSN